MKVAPGNPYAAAGTDGKDLGADFDQLPLIHNVQVVAANRSAELEFDLTAPISDVGGNQPCVLEVSTDRNLYSDLGSYEVIPDLNPVLFRQADSSKRTNPKLKPVQITGNHVIWPLGEEAKVVSSDDGNTTQILSLEEGRVYYGRLMCYGDSQLFIFRTTAESNRRRLQFKVATTPNVTGVQVQYGSTPNTLEKQNVPVGHGGGVAIDIPMSEDTTYYQVEFSAGTQTVYKSKLGSYSSLSRNHISNTSKDHNHHE